MKKLLLLALVPLVLGGCVATSKEKTYLIDVDRCIERTGSASVKKQERGFVTSCPISTPKTN